ETFAESGFDVSTFEVVPPSRAADPVFDVSFPDPLDYDVIVPLGARWAVYDDRLAERWVGAEIAMVRRGLDAGAGVLGVCFGAQLLATALGGTVARSPHPEIGWCDVDSTRPDLVPDGPWFQWHFDRFTLPPDAVEIARNDRATQAFVQGRAMGLQFHPEVDRALVERWTAEDTGGDIGGLGLHPDDVRVHTDALADDAAARLRLLVAGFIGLLDKDPQHGLHGVR
ncbi:MAG: type 1 glutamine amidotransferase, partial [Mycobacteriaceae bacterium]